MLVHEHDSATALVDTVEPAAPVRRTRRLVVGGAAAALGVALMTPAPAGGVVLAPDHLFSTVGLAVDDAAVADPMPVTGGVPEGLLALGDKGRQVAWVQRVLGVPATGYFGPATRAAVVRFQESVGDSVGTGLVGPLTLAQLTAYDAKQKAAARAAAAKARAEAARKAAAAKAAAAKAAAARQQAASRTRSSSTSTSSGDPTMTSAARTSRTAREAVPLSVWVSSKHARYVADRESNFRCTAVSPGGSYRGKWQMSASLWKGYGGLSYAPTADQASCAEQDKVAYRVWLAQWWYPWGG